MSVYKETKDLARQGAPPLLAWLAGFAVVAVVVTVVVLGINWFAAPAQVAIENRTFHQSQPYLDGMVRDLDNLRLAYDGASPEGKMTIKATIQHRFAGFDRASVPADDQAFLAEMMH